LEAPITEKAGVAAMDVGPAAPGLDHRMVVSSQQDFRHESFSFDLAIPRFGPTVLVKPDVCRPEIVARRAT
jgi:hypothetical protein